MLTYVRGTNHDTPTVQHQHVLPEVLNDISYGLRSVQDELKRESNADAPTVALSYVAMLLYVAIALSWSPKKFTECWQVFVHSRVFLALGGVVIVLAAVVGSLGICGWLGVKATLIIMEVIPFLVLAVGVDNMFILAHDLQKQVRLYTMICCQISSHEHLSDNIRNWIPQVNSHLMLISSSSIS